MNTITSDSLSSGQEFFNTQKQQKEAYIDKEWLTVQNYQFKILVMIAVLAENHLAYRGKLKDMCEFLGVKPSAYNNGKIKEAIEALEENGDIKYIKEGQTWTLTLSVKAEKKKKVIRIKHGWISAIKKYQGPVGQEVAWENILKVLVYLIADKEDVKTYKKISEDLNLDQNCIKRSIYALDGIDFGDLAITRKLAWFKNEKDEFKVKGQRISAWQTFEG